MELKLLESTDYEKSLSKKMLPRASIVRPGHLSFNQAAFKMIGFKMHDTIVLATEKHDNELLRIFLKKTKRRPTKNSFLVKKSGNSLYVDIRHILNNSNSFFKERKRYEVKEINFEKHHFIMARNAFVLELIKK